MKPLYTKLILGLFLCLFTSVFAQRKKENYIVQGECGMCKTRIESTAKKAGTTAAVWNPETKTLSVEFDQSKTNKDAILKKIAEVGHDNELYKTDASVYETLPDCCHYQREKLAEVKTISSKKENEFWVKGNCGSCKNRIEKAAKDAGATSAFWNADTQSVILDFDPSKISAEKILQKIAEVGHDNELFKAPDSTYKNLPGCCLYDREIPFGEKNPLAHHDEISTPQNGIKEENHAGHNHTKTDTFSVKGNCAECEERIESTALQNGATSANWDKETQILTVSFDTEKTSAENILKKIADAGHDNQLFKTSDSTYKNLPSCCYYDRKSEFPKNGEKLLLENGHVAVPNIILSAGENSKTTDIQGVTVTKMREATALSKKEAGLTFNIDSKELLKAACCNLSESFETNATVDVAYNNAVTGTKQLKMLGLDQKYTALTKELLPEIRGIASAYGLNFIPGRWIGGIQLTKGGSTVTNGYESITGQINTELLKFSGKNETALNIFADNNARTEINITNVSALNDHWNQSILIHGNGTFAKMDYNKDGFLDQPTGNQVNVAYLLNYNDLEHSGWASHIGINFLRDTRNAGQMEYDKTKDQSEQSAYGVGIDIGRIQVWNKTGYIFKGKPYRSLGWMNQYTYHQQNSFFGLRNYDGKQNTYYSNLIYEDILGNTNHKYKVGASFLYDQFHEHYPHTTYMRTETVPGLFAEYTLTGAKYTLVAGSRVDFHNLAGTQFSPRLNFKYDFTPKTIVRLSAGRGFRTANIFAENQQYFASNRSIEILSNGGKIYGLDPEIAWNYGASIQQEFKLFGRKSSIVADFFRTDFQNQVVVDLDQSARKIVFYNLDGKSFANSFQTQWDFIPLQNLEIRLAYKYYDVATDYLSGLKKVPFMAKHRGFANLAYSTVKNEKGGFWSFDTTLNIVGKQRLPNTSDNPAEFRLSDYSDPYTTLNAQVSKNFNSKIRAYVGMDNITSTKQKNPIIDAQNPFGDYFDGSMIYAPIMPGNVYVGLDVSF